MIFKNAHLFFEQSGTFKNEFIKLGKNAFDYDILNNFKQTDFIIDLFDQIEKCYIGKNSIFDNFNSDDLIFAFFPCTRFESQINLYFRGKAFGQRLWCEKDKLKYSIMLHDELNLYYDVICKLFYICYVRNLKLIVENPVTQPHYLTLYFPIPPAIIDNDRRKMGDYFKKPTQYWFINCVPSQNIFFESLEYLKSKTIKNYHNQIERSLISSQYARRFILTYILENNDLPEEVIKYVSDR